MPDIKINVCVVMTPHELHLFSLKIFIVRVVLNYGCWLKQLS